MDQMQQDAAIREGIREDIKSLAKEHSGIVHKAMVLPCQKKCLSFDTREVSDQEYECLYACLDKMSFFDNTTFELDSASSAAAASGKPKKAVIYYGRRIADLTRMPQ